MRALEVCSGIGGLALGLAWAGWEIAALSEADERCRAELALHWPHVPIFADIANLTDEKLDAVGPVDLLAGGIPCQPWSHAGKRGGDADERDLWPAFLDLVERTGVRCVLIENVPGLASHPGGLDRIAADLERRGYAWWACRLRAADVGAPHLRDRLWVCAMADLLGEGREGRRRAGAGLQRPAAERGGAAGGRAVGDAFGGPAQRRGEPGELRGAAGFAGDQGHQWERGWHAASAAGAGPSTVGDAERGGPGRLAIDAGWHDPDRHPPGRPQGSGRAAIPSPWADARPVLCRDGKLRLVPAELAVQPMADGFPPALAELYPLAPPEPGRIARLRAIGNAVVPLQAYVPARALYEVANAVFTERKAASTSPA